MSSESSTPPPSAKPTAMPGNRTGHKPPLKKKPEDYIFGKVIGEGSYSTVFLAKEINSNRESAIKVLEKRFIVKEKKTEYVTREKQVFTLLNHHPFFVLLECTFQDPERLYFVLTYARKGELLEYINKMGSFDLEQTRFYSAEIVSALEYLHSKGIIHRDLKPENILLNDKMHIQITDFGSAKILGQNQGQEQTQGPDNIQQTQRRRASFVGTAQYVSPEMLTAKQAHYSSDLWALGSIIYQLLGGLTPFRGRHEYEIFQKIQKLDYSFPEGFDPVARDLVEKLLVIDPTKRLGCEEMGGFGPLKSHPFFEGINWEDLANQTPPPLLDIGKNKKEEPEDLWTDVQPGYSEMHISRLLCKVVQVDDIIECQESYDESISEEQHKEELERQAKENNYHSFVENHLILKQGLLDKKRGLFSRRRMFLLTEGPHLYYVDPVNMVLKGQIPWSRELRPEAKNFHHFYVHTPRRTYYLDDPEGYALQWVDKIREVWHRYYGVTNPKKS